MTNEELQDAILLTRAMYKKEEGGNVKTELYKHFCNLLDEQRRRAQEKTQ